jgi:surfactin synthase thioesterase subunit
MGGMQDPVIQDKLEQWKDVTRKECEVYYFSGGHFYLEENEQEIVDLIYRTVEMCNNM